MKRTKICQIHEGVIGHSITVSGWIRTARVQKRITFVDINDGSTLSGLQVVIGQDNAGDMNPLETLTTGTSVRVRGLLVPSPTSHKQKWELRAEHCDILGRCDPETYPLQKKRHSPEFLRTIAHLRPRTATQGAVLRIRNALAFATHQFFQERRFLYIQSPLLTGSDCEGGGEQFLCTTLNLKRPPERPNGDIDFSQDFFGRAAYLTVSGQLNAEALACALSDVYTFGPAFRAENSNTSRHLAEFWMIEPEMAFATLDDDIECAESYLKFVVRYILSHCHDDLQFFDQSLEPDLIRRLHAIVEVPFARLTYTEAVHILEGSGKAFEFPHHWGVDLQSEHERYIAEEYCKTPVILTDYPREIKAFYMRVNDDERTVAAMDVLVPKIGEIIGGSQREDRFDVLHSRIVDFGLNPEEYWWYLELRKYGSVPHAGFGAGFERLVQFVTGVENIRDVIPFPRYPGNLAF